MLIDSSTRRNLELTETMRDKQKRGSLLWVLDKTKTAMGARTLRTMTQQPLVNKDMIEERLDAVEYFYNESIDTLGIKVKRDFQYGQTVEMDEGILLDFDIDNVPTALELLNASEKLSVPKESFEKMHCFNMKVCVDKDSILMCAIFGFMIPNKDDEYELNYFIENNFDFVPTETELVIA